MGSKHHTMERLQQRRHVARRHPQCPHQGGKQMLEVAQAEACSACFRAGSPPPSKDTVAALVELHPDFHEFEASLQLTLVLEALDSLGQVVRDSVRADTAHLDSDVDDE
eukprot:187549-Pyramimonas_sp.AAC.1